MKTIPAVTSIFLIVQQKYTQDNSKYNISGLENSLDDNYTYTHWIYAAILFGVLVYKILPCWNLNNKASWWNTYKSSRRRSDTCQWIYFSFLNISEWTNMSRADCLVTIKGIMWHIYIRMTFIRMQRLRKIQSMSQCYSRTDSVWRPGFDLVGLHQRLPNSGTTSKIHT